MDKNPLIPMVLCSAMVVLAFEVETVKAAQTSTMQTGGMATQQTAAADLSFETDKLIGAEVTNTQGEKLGKIRNVAIGSDGRVSYVVLGTGGMAGINEKLLAIPWSQLKVSDAGAKVSLDVSKQRLTSDFAAFEDLRKGKAMPKGAAEPSGEMMEPRPGN